MGKPWTEQQIQRWSRELAGHAKDKDRARRKRRLAGEAPAAPARPRARALPGDDAAEDDADLTAETNGEAPDEASD
ncbi:MAG: hypothetical protein AB7O37_19220 [Vicinamibacteria bacterium]